MTDAGTTQDNFILSAPPVGGLPIHGPIAPRANVLTTELLLAPETDQAGGRLMTIQSLHTNGLYIDRVLLV